MSNEPRVPELRRTIVTRPAYDNTHVSDFNRWTADNEPTLRTWWSTCNFACGILYTNAAEDFDFFVRYQYQREFALRME